MKFTRPEARNVYSRIPLCVNSRRRINFATRNERRNLSTFMFSECEIAEREESFIDFSTLPCFHIFSLKSENLQDFSDSRSECGEL